MASRILAFRKTVTMHDAALVVAILTCILSVVPVAGLYARAYMEPLAEPDQAVIAVINELLGPFARALIGLAILFAIQSTASSLLHTIGSAASHDLRLALIPRKKLEPSRVLAIDRTTVFVFGVLGLLGMLYAPPFMLVWLGILGTGTLLASFAVPVFFSSFWLGNGYGTLAAMLSGFAVSATMLLYFESGWIEGPLLGCVVSAVAYYLVSLATFSRQPRLS
jgi:sodium/pantothenate symporter